MSGDLVQVTKRKRQCSDRKPEMKPEKNDSSMSFLPQRTVEV